MKKPDFYTSNTYHAANDFLVEISCQIIQTDYLNKYSVYYIPLVPKLLQVQTRINRIHNQEVD